MTWWPLDMNKRGTRVRLAVKLLVRGEGDAQRTRIFAQAYGRDPSFAAFYRSMQAYEASLGQGDTTLVLSPDSAFFRYFERGPTGR